jgi:hypothetical protein
MAVLIVPRFDPDEPFPTLGPQICAHIEEKLVFGNGSLKGEPAKLDPETRGIIYSTYEVYPRKHRLAGRRRHKRAYWSLRKGLAKTEKMAWVAAEELHPDAPVRCDGFDAYGEPVGRPVKDPYIPLLAVTVEQVEELAYGALKTIIEECEDSAMFDASNERIIRLDGRGREDGKCQALSNSPGARDGARTTFQGFDEPHRLFLPRQKQAHETMLGNMSKRAMEDPWSLYVGTAGEPGQESIAEDLHHEAQLLDEGKAKPEEAKLFCFYRWAGGTYDLTKQEDRIAAVIEATGPHEEWGPGQFEDIASNWTRHGADLQYLERVWLNRWIRSNQQAFDPNKRIELMTTINPFTRRAFITGGFDGARFRDSTGIVLTDIETGIQKVHACWERQEFNTDPVTGDLEPWEIDEEEVNESVDKMYRDFDVWRFNCDPPHWVEPIATWAQKHETVEEWWTARLKAMAYAVRNYKEAIDSSAISFYEDEEVWSTHRGKEETYAEMFARHYAAAGRNDLHFPDDDGKPLYVLRKLHRTRVFDVQMAAILSWEARLEALKKNAKPSRRRSTTVKRLR